MGTTLLQYYRTRVKREHKIAFFSALLLCLLVHLYKFTNTLPNHDSMYSAYDNQEMTVSGRWFLSIACGLSSYFDLPWLIGVLCAVYLALTMVIITALFDIKNPVAICLSSFLLVSFPSATETFFFLFTADGYLLSMLLSALAAYLSCKHTHWYTYVLSGVCLCLSCAIYQAYVSFALLLVLFYFIHLLINGQLRGKELRNRIFLQIIVFVAAMAVYYVVWKLVLNLTGQTAADYQGINNVGNLSLRSILNGAITSVSNLFFFFLEWNIFKHPINLYGILNILFLLVFFAGLFMVMWKTRKNRTVLQTLLILLCLVLCIPCISMWCFASNGVGYRPMMLYSIYVLFLYAVILFDKYFSPKWSTAAAVFLFVIAFNFSIIANISYYHMNKSYEKSYATGLQMVTRMQALPEIEDATELVFVGNSLPDVAYGGSEPSSKIHLLALGLEEDMLYDNVHAYLFLKEVFAMSLDTVSSNEVERWEDLPEVSDMGIWPSADSVKIIGHTVVIKLAEATTDTP